MPLPTNDSESHALSSLAGRPGPGPGRAPAVTVTVDRDRATAAQVAPRDLPNPRGRAGANKTDLGRSQVQEVLESLVASEYPDAGGQQRRPQPGKICIPVRGQCQSLRRIVTGPAVGWPRPRRRPVRGRSVAGAFKVRDQLDKELKAVALQRSLGAYGGPAS